MPAMPTPQALPTPVPEWIDKEAVARRLKISERTANSLAEKGIIKARKVRSANNQLVWMFHSGDVERYAFERDHPETIAVVKQASQSLQPALPAPPPDNIPSYIMRPWLTLEEAAEYSGLTKRWLLAQAERSENLAQGTIPGPDILSIRDMGKHSPGGRWRFHRETLNCG